MQHMYSSKSQWFRFALVPLFVLAPVVAYPQQPATAVPVTEISADLGPCSADFHVTDMAGNPLYNAKVHALIRYGFMSKRKLELDAGTNSEGRARVVKLPAEIKKPIEITVSYGTDSATRSFNPATDCHVTYNVPLKK